MIKIIVALTLFSCTISQAANYSCTPEDRKLDCTTYKTEEVCGVSYCSDKKCFNSFKSQCDACRDPATVVVIFATCISVNPPAQYENEGTVTTGNETTPPTGVVVTLPAITEGGEAAYSPVSSVYSCTDEDRKPCPQYLTKQAQTAVCGLFDTSQIRCFAYPCGQTYYSVCEACNNLQVKEVVKSSCEDLRKAQVDPMPQVVEIDKCLDSDKTITSCDEFKGEEVCGFRGENCQENCNHTFTNRCYACWKSDIVYTIPGVCRNDHVDPMPPVEAIDKCLDSDKTITSCDEFKGEEVCGFRGENCQENCNDTFTNRCYACWKSDIVYTIPGVCRKDQVDPIHPIDPIVDPIYPNPINIDYSCDSFSEQTDCTLSKDLDKVCVIENGVPKTYDNKCIACTKNNNRKNLIVIKGECPSNHIVCQDSQRENICTMEYIGVCTLQTYLNSEICTSNCIHTYGTTCQACSDPNVSLVFPDGSCDVIFPLSVNIFYYPVVVDDNGFIYDNMEKGKVAIPPVDSNMAYTTGAANTATVKVNGDSYTTTTGSINKAEVPLTDKVYKAADTAAAGTNLNQEIKATVTSTDNKQENSTAVQTEKLKGIICKDTDKAQVCLNDNKKVCSYKKCTSGFCPESKINKCEACRDSNSLFYVPADCITFSFKNITVPCLSDQRNLNCSAFTTTVDSAVCGNYAQFSKFCMGTNSTCTETFTSSCEACRNNDVESYENNVCASSYISLAIISIFSLFLIL